MHESEALVGDTPPAEPAAPSVPLVVTYASDIMQSSVVDQVASMLASFKESVEARLSQIDIRFSQVNSSSASLSQDSYVSCLSAPTPVAVRSEHPPDRGSLPPCNIETDWDLP